MLLGLSPQSKIGVIVPREHEWKAAQRRQMTCPRSHGQQVASLGCAPCVSGLSTSIWAGPQSPSDPSNILCDRFVQPPLANHSDGELIAHFWLLVSVDLLSPRTT